MTEPIVEEELKASGRYWWHVITEMIQSNVVPALVEFITNSDDSYARLESQGRALSGRIQIDVIERRSGQDSSVIITDDAEGFSAEQLRERFGTMGADTSGSANVRGFFGDGLKEGVLGLQRGGTLQTIRDGLMSRAELVWIDRKPVYTERQLGVEVDPAIRQNLGLQGDGSRLEVYVASDVRLPRHEKLYETLTRHYALRGILQSETRTVRLRRLNDKGRVLQQDDLSYRDPVRDDAFESIDVEGTVAGYPDARYELAVWRSTEPLSGPEAGAQRQSGIIVEARRALVDIGFFGHENRSGTEYLYGRLVCPVLYDRLRSGDMVVAKNRSGLNRRNDFVIALLAELDKILKPVVAAEAERLRRVETQNVDPKSRKRIEELRRELNKIAQEELEEEGDEPGDEEGTPDFRFSGRGYTVYCGEERVVKALLRASVIAGPTTAEFSVAGEGLSVHPMKVAVSPQSAVEGLIVVEARVHGDKVLDAGLVEAAVESHKASATIVVKERDTTPPPTFAFVSQFYRVPVSEWKEVALRIHIPSAPLLPAQVTFDLDKGDLEVRPSTEIADPENARGEWLTLRVNVRGDQIGSADTLEARLGNLVATTNLRVVSKEEPDKPGRGGLIKDIKLDSRENPTQRTYFREGVITVFVNHPSLRRYLLKPDDQAKPAGRALLADLVMHAFCRHVAERTYLDSTFVNDPESAVQTVFSIYEQMLKKHGQRVHSIMNPD